MTAVTWTYLGEFPGQRYARLAVYRDEQGERHGYKSGKDSRGVVGGLHRVQIDAEGSLIDWPTWTGEYAEDAETLRLEERGRARKRERAAAEAKARREHPAADVLAEVARLAKGTTSGARAALIDDLSRAIWRA